MASLRSPAARTLATLLGVVTFLAMTAVRFYWEFTGEYPTLDPLGMSVDGTVLRIVAIVTLVAVGWQAVSGRDWREAAVVIAGPLVGFGAFIALHWAVFGPSTDSPTWLIYLALCSAAAVVGGVTYGVGAVARRVRNSRTAKPRC